MQVDTDNDDKDDNNDDFGDNDADFDDDEFGDDDGFGDDDDGGWGDTELVSQDDAMMAIKKINDTDMTNNNSNNNSNDKEEKEAVSWNCSEMVDKLNEDTNEMDKEECGFHNTVHPSICQECGAINLGMATSMMDENQKKEGSFWSQLFEKVYLTLESQKRKKNKNKNKNDNNNQFDLKTIRSVVDDIFLHESIPLHVVELRPSGNNVEKKSDTCITCSGAFGTEVIRCNDLKCHENVCKECIGGWIRSLIDREIITPFLKCPSRVGETYDSKTGQLVIDNCEKAIPISVLFDNDIALPIIYLYEFASKFCQLRLGAVKKWRQCPNNKVNCRYGILFAPSDDSTKKAKCLNCGLQSTYQLELEFDLETKKWIKEGKVRLCPKCELPHMKDKGLCNVMKCGKCGVWWNWRSRETGTTEHELKNIARGNHTLWEPGELEYQQKLQKEDLPEFIKLLKKNGIKYDPNYVRGR